MEKSRQTEIITALWKFNGGRISPAQLNAIVKDKAEEHFAVLKLRGMGITLSHEYRTLAYGEEQAEAFRRRKDIERELTIQRKRERQHKVLLHTV